MGTKDDGLKLSLSLGCAAQENQPSLKLNLMLFPSPFTQNNHHKSPRNQLFQSSERSSDTRSYSRGIDMNRVPLVANSGEETGVSSPNSTISSISGKRSEREPIGGETKTEGASTSRASDDEDGGAGGDASKKKLRLSKDQAFVLEETFKEQSTLNPRAKLALAKQLNLRTRQVEVWFQNRRARTKLKQTEVDCEYLKRCCENLTEENRRLQKEVRELKALKVSQQLYMNPPTTLTMCPSCERVAVSSSSAPTAPTRILADPNHRRVPINSWAAMPIHHPVFDTSASGSR